MTVSTGWSGSSSAAGVEGFLDLVGSIHTYLFLSYIWSYPFFVFSSLIKLPGEYCLSILTPRVLTLVKKRDFLLCFAGLFAGFVFFVLYWFELILMFVCHGP